MNRALITHVVIVLSPQSRARWFTFLCAILAVATGVAQGAGEQLPSFEVTGQHVTNLAVLVTKEGRNRERAAKTVEQLRDALATAER